VAVARVPGLRSRRAAGSPSFAAHHAICRAAKPDAPAVLADLELAKPCCAELRDQRREQLRRETIDRCVVGGMTVGSIVDRTRLGHSLDLLIGRRLVT
jgi:hypothetical protein